MENLEQAANIEEVAALETEIEPEVTEETTQEIPEEPKDVTETQAFARRLREATEKAKAEAADEQISKMFGESHNIHSVVEYEKAIKQQEEEAKQKAMEDQIRAKYSYLDDEIVEEMIAGKQFREKFEQKEQETLKQQQERESQEKESAHKQAETQEFFELFKEENGRAWDAEDGIPKEVLEYQAKGKSLPDAYNAYLKATYKSKIGATEVNEKNAKSSTGSVTGNGSTGTGDISKETFEAKKHDREWVIKNFSKITESRAKW